MKEKEITVLKVEPGKSPETVTMPNTLDAMQKMVGGYIEVLPLSDVCLVCNEDGKLLGLEGNRRLGNDIIVGTFFLAGVIFVLLPKSRYNTLVKCLLSRIPSNQVR